MKALKIGQPRPIHPRDLRNMGSPISKRSSTVGSDVSTASSTWTYAEFRREEKLREDVHASGGSWIELFYDLFFAASLSAFSNTREISGQKDLVDLAAFFTILWWTWTSQTLFDVRYSRHAKSEKIMKLMQILIMVGYGVFEGNFSLFLGSHVEPGVGTRAKSILSAHRKAGPRTSAIAITSLFILSRFQLAGQYLRVAINRKSSTGQIRKANLVSAALPIVASFFWFASLLVLDVKVSTHGFFAPRSALWITGILVEMLGTIALRLHKQTSFGKTHLTERFGSLTIIIIGEGVIKLVTILREISVGLGFEFKSVIAIATSIISFYLLFAIYFEDFSLHEGIGVTGYYWAYMHYLFHMALVLALDGITSLLLFTNIFGGMKSLLNPERETGIIEDLLNLQNTSLATTVPSTLGKVTFIYNTQNNIMSNNGTELSQSQYDYVFINLFERIFRSYSVEPSESFLDFLEELAPDELNESQLSRAFNLLLRQFIVSAQYFLIAGGLIFLTLVPLMYWQRRLQTANWSRWVPLGIRVILGLLFLGLAGLADSGGDRLGKALMGGWLLPGFMGASLVIYFVDWLTVRYLQFK